MAEGADGTSELTVEDAASQIEALIPDEGDDQPETGTPAEEAEPTPDEIDAPADGEEPSETVDSDEPGTDDEPSDDAATTEEEPPQPVTRRVKVDGEEIEVTEEELLKGYSRTADYTRKTQTLAEERKRFEQEEVAAVKAERAQYAQYLGQLRTVLETRAPEPDWAAIQKDQPDEFPRIHAEWTLEQQRIAKVKEEEAKVSAKVAADEQAAYDAHLATEQQKLTAALPEWSKEEVAVRERKELAEYAAAQGYSAADLAHVIDHRVVVMLRKAMLFDRAQAAARAKPPAKPLAAPAAKPATRVVKPGPSASVKGAKGNPREATMRQLRATGDVKDAAAAIETLLDD